MSKQKEKLFAYEVFMAQATKEGRVRREELSMKVLKPDLSLQARVDHINVDHVRALHEIIKNGQPLAPIIVFEVADGVFKIADGFHRHEVYRKEGLPGIPCIVVKGTLQEAIEYAASANQMLSLRRKREDVCKAVWMLLDNGWLNKTYKEIARQAGTMPLTAKKHCNSYRESKGLPVNRGAEPAARQPKLHSYTTPNGSKYECYRVKAFGKTFSGTSPDKAMRRYQGYADARAKTPKADLVVATGFTPDDYRRLPGYLVRRGVVVDNSEHPGALRLVPGFTVGSFAVGHLSSEDAIASSYTRSLVGAVGRVLILAAHYGSRRKVVVTAKVLDGYAEVTKSARRLGVEFMTLDEFVAAVKADEAAQAEGRAG